MVRANEDVVRGAGLRVTTQLLAVLDPRAEVLFWGLRTGCQQEDSEGSKELFA